jgi:hypothetical protein
MSDARTIGEDRSYNVADAKTIGVELAALDARVSTARSTNNAASAMPTAPIRSELSADT